MRISNGSSDVCSSDHEFSDPTLSSADNITETQTPFKPEKQRSFELGTKSMWLDQRVVLNAAVYYNKARDLQESIFLGSGAAASSVRNAGKATIYGAELEGQIALWSGSRLGLDRKSTRLNSSH